MDVACGNGEITRDLSKNNIVIGCDGSLGALKMVPFPSVLCDVTQHFPFHSNTFDIVIAAEIIEHVVDTDKLILEINRVLKKHGLLFITTPNLVNIESRLAFLLGKKPWMIGNRLKDGYAGHLRYFTFKELEELLVDNGFKVVKKSSTFIKIRSLIFIKLANLFPTFGQNIIFVAKKYNFLNYYCPLE